MLLKDAAKPVNEKRIKELLEKTKANEQELLETEAA
jgi:hypothetical protein